MKVLIVEDHALMREACTDVVRQCLPDALVCSVSSLSAAEELSQRDGTSFDLALLDLVLPRECSGVNTVTRFNAIFPGVPILAMSGLNSEDMVKALRRAGVIAYVSKASDPEVLEQAIRAAAQGHLFIEDELTHLWQNQAVDSSPMLSERQMQILEGLAQGKPDKAIARELHISDDTVAYHIKSIFLLLGTTSRAQAVSKGFQMGLLSFI